MKKTVFILNIPPPYGGGEIVSQHLYSHLRGKYTFLINSRDRHDKSTQGKISFRNVYWGVKLIFKAISKIIEVKADVVYIGIGKDLPSFIRDSVIILAAKLLGATLVCELHGMSFLFIEYPTKNKLFHFVINKIDKLRVLSTSIETYLRGQGYENTIKVIDNGIPAPDACAKKIEGSLRFLYMGTISKKKGFLTVVKFLETLKEAGISDFSLDVLGEWEDIAFKYAVLASLKESIVKDNIIFHGLIKNEKKWEYFKQAHIMVHFSEWDGQPLTIIEAMSQGVPVIATRVGAIPEMIDTTINGFLVDSPVEEAKNIVLAFTDGRLDYHEISKKAIETYNSRFTVEIMAARIEDLIRKEA